MFSYVVVLSLLALASGSHLVPRWMNLMEAHSGCDDLYRNAGLSANFNETMGHAIHAMTVQGLRMFNPRASAANNVPTVNHDLGAPQKVLMYAPDDPMGDDFTTFAMNSLDQIMSHVGVDDDGLGPHWSPIERVAHKFHMWDLWVKVAKVHEAKVKSSPPSPGLCSCLTDTKANGIFKAVSWVADHYKTGHPITLLGRPIPDLVDAATWSVWMKRFLWYYTDNALFDAATYLHCATSNF